MELNLPLRPVSLIWDGPRAVTESRYGIALGYYVTCDDALCRDCFDKPGYTWPGFEGWEEPIAIFNDSESDTPTHCCQCGAVIRHDLTPDGGEYVKDAVAE